MGKKVILTGLRANNDLHIGNYFGAILPMVDMANNKSSEYQINLFIPDLHSFTTPIDHKQLQKQIMHNLKLFIAAGLPIDNASVHIYRQSYVSAHSELAWILDCFTGMGEMSRMTQYKDKSKIQDIYSLLNQFKARSPERLLSAEFVSNAEKAENDKNYDKLEKLFIQLMNKHTEEVDFASDILETLFDSLKNTESTTVGLFNYPVLMAADILLYNATYVPVGDDQTQHLEFTRDIAERMNKKFGELFTVPLEVKKQHEFFARDQGLRIMDLADPTKKMSKSDDTGKGVIFLGDKPDTVRKKIMSATTDSVGVIKYDTKNQPGLANIIELIALLDGVKPEEVAKRYDGQTMYGPLKTELADKMAEFIQDFQSRLAKVDENIVLAKLEKSEIVMNKQANETLLKVQKAVGLR